MASIQFPMRKDLPPEAYTRETLQKAFNWLQEQPEPVRSSVHTPESLVSLFQKSQRLNDEDAPVSSKKFMSDLKNLATSLDQFEAPKASNKPNPPPTPQKEKPEPKSALFDFSTETAAPPTDFSPAKVEQQQVLINSEPIAAPPSVEEKVQESKPSFEFAMDPISQSRITRVRERFNLSSDQEAIRLLISIGYEKITHI